MSNVSKYIKVHPNVLVEWIYDSDNYVASDYTVIADALNSKRSFALSYPSTTDPTTRDANRDDRQLFQLDPISNKWSVADPAQRAFIQHEDHVSPAPSRYDRVRVYFPVNYVFEDVAGFYLGISAYDYDNKKLFGLANYFIDSTDPAQVNELRLLSPPWPFQEGLWGKTLDILVPSLYDESRARTNNRPTPGTINYNLTGGLTGDGLSQTSPVIIDFRFIERRETLLGKTQYTLASANLASVPQAPEYQALGVAIEKADDGDYFEIFGTFNGNTADFDDFMYALAESGQRNTVLFTVTVFEEGLAQDPITFRIADNYNKRIPFCPVLKFTNTTASIAVSMSIIDDVDGSTEVRNAEIGLYANDVSKYGRNRLAINLSNAIKPKVYVARPDQVILGSGGLTAGSRRVQTQVQTQIKFKPVPQLSSDFNIVAADVNASRQGDTYFGKGLLLIKLHPFDNILRFHLAREVSEAAYTPFALAGNDATLMLAFRTAGRSIEVDVYRESPELAPQNGVFIYLLKESDVQQLRTMVVENDNFYLTINNTVAYHGKYGLSGMDVPVKVVDIVAAPVDTKTPLVRDIIREIQTPVTPPTLPGNGGPLVIQQPVSPDDATPADGGADTTGQDAGYAPYYGGGYGAGGGSGSRYKEDCNCDNETQVVNFALIN